MTFQKMLVHFDVNPWIENVHVMNYTFAAKAIEGTILYRC